MTRTASFYRILLLAAVSAAFVAGFGCASRRGASDGGSGASSEGFDPKTDVFEVPERKPGVEGQDKVSGNPDWKAVDSIAKSQKSARAPKSVFRVQLFASQYYSEAVRERDVANDVFNEPVFLVYDSPYYKIFVGNCVQRKEGVDLLGLARTLGYKDSWLTESEPDSLYFDAPKVADSASSARDPSQRNVGVTPHH